MAKAKWTTPEEAEELLKSTTEERDVARNELKEYRKEHKLKKEEDYSQDPKHSKKLEKWAATIAKKTELIDEIKEWKKENKPKKEPKERASIYEYPKNEAGEEMTADEKKRYRAKMRTKKKSEEKAAAKGETSTEDAKEGKKTKKDKKKKEDAGGEGEESGKQGGGDD